MRIPRPQTAAAQPNLRTKHKKQYKTAAGQSDRVYKDKSLETKDLLNKNLHLVFCWKGGRDLLLDRKLKIKH
ncbi:hypothetical protein P8452_02383 [Trifolium repens]|nr:hypothetical protein P8452_02383 [Trifolium repens]